MTVSSFFISFSFSVLWIFSLYYDVQFQPRLGHDWYIYKLVMLTNLNFVLDTIYSILVILSYTRIKKINKIVDFMFFTSIFPVAFITCGLFWTLFIIDPNLVMPDWIAKIIPSWLNHVTHTLPIIYVLFDNFLHRRISPTFRTLLKSSFVLVAIYFSIIFYVRFFDGYWLYPLLQLFSPWHFLLALVLGVVGFVILTQFAVLINWTIWRKTKKSKTN